MIGLGEIIAAWKMIQQASESIDAWVPAAPDDMDDNDREVAAWFYKSSARNMGYDDDAFMQWAIQYAHCNASLLEDDNVPVAVAVMMQRAFAMGLVLGRTNPI